MRTDDKICLVALITTIVLMWVVFLIATANTKPKVVECSGTSKEQTGSDMVMVSTSEPRVFTAPEETSEPTAEPLTNLGEFKLTAYCSCEKCCGIWAYNRPNGIVYGAIGEELKENYSIAVDPDVIPYRSEVIINGKTYKAQDCGGAIKGNRIDVYFEDHNDALEFGVQYKEVFVKM